MINTCLNRSWRLYSKLLICLSLCSLALLGLGGLICMWDIAVGSCQWLLTWPLKSYSSICMASDVRSKVVSCCWHHASDGAQMDASAPPGGFSSRGLNHQLLLTHNWDSEAFISPFLFCLNAGVKKGVAKGSSYSTNKHVDPQTIFWTNWDEDTVSWQSREVSAKPP